MNYFYQGNTIFLKSVASQKNLRIHSNGIVDGNGGTGKFAQFVVHTTNTGTVKLQSAANPQYWLRINNNGVLDGMVKLSMLKRF